LDAKPQGETSFQLQGKVSKRLAFCHLGSIYNTTFGHLVCSFVTDAGQPLSRCLGFQIDLLPHMEYGISRAEFVAGLANLSGNKAR